MKFRFVQQGRLWHEDSDDLGCWDFDDAYLLTPYLALRICGKQWDREQDFSLVKTWEEVLEGGDG